MKIFVTGASGFIGNKLSIQLADQGHEVHALVRSLSSARWLTHSGIKVFQGDILNSESLITAMKGCQQVYHVAGKAGAWAKDVSEFYSVNVEGTRNVLVVARKLDVQKIVYTSSCGVLGPTLDEPVKEDRQRIIDFVLDYDRSKKMAEDIVLRFVAGGMNVVIVSPAKVYGPGKISHSLMLNAVINNFLKKRITFIPSPGSFRVGFVSVDDIVTGHILAMENGRPGETYILGGTNISYYEFFNRLRILSSGKGQIFMVPRSIVTMWAFIQKINHELWDTPVLFTPQSVNHLFSHYTFSSNKAIRELGYSITPLDEVLEKTIHYLNSEHLKLN